jgi:hypothetical protein
MRRDDLSGGNLATWADVPKSVWALGFVSLQMDVSSELINSLPPVFLVTVIGTSMAGRRFDRGRRQGYRHHYVVRERRRIWSSRPSLLLIVSSIVDVLIIGTLALGGILMTPLTPSIVVSILAAAIVLALVMDQAKAWLFIQFKMAQPRKR